MSNKEAALKVISELPDNTTFEEIMYQLYVLEKIQSGESDVTNNRFSSVDDFEEESKNW